MNTDYDLPISILEVDSKSIEQLRQSEIQTIGELLTFLKATIGCGAIIPVSRNGVRLVEVDFRTILAELKIHQYWPDTIQFDDMTIDEFEVSEACQNALKKSGFSTLQEMVEVFEEILIAAPTFSGSWLKYHQEIFDGLRKLGFWSECIAD